MMSGRPADADTGITKRVEHLRDMPGLSRQDLTAIDDAIRDLRILEQAGTKYSGAEQLTAGKSALQKLRSIERAVEQLKPTAT